MLPISALPLIQPISPQLLIHHLAGDVSCIITGYWHRGKHLPPWVPSPVLPEEPISFHSSTPDLGAISPHLYDKILSAPLLFTAHAPKANVLAWLAGIPDLLSDSEHLLLVLASNLEWNGLRFCSPGNFNFVRIGEETACVPESHTITLCNPWYCWDYSWLCHWCPSETTAVGNSGLYEAWESLGDILAVSPQ